MLHEHVVRQLPGLYKNIAAHEGEESLRRDGPVKFIDDILNLGAVPGYEYMDNSIRENREEAEKIIAGLMGMM